MRELVATIRKRKLQYFGHMIRAQNLFTHISEGRLDGTESKCWSNNVKDRTGETPAEYTACRKKQEEYERTNVLYRGRRVSVMKKEKRRWRPKEIKSWGH